LRRPIDPPESFSALQTHPQALQEDFEEFFPELRARFLPPKH
jgi:hypothetical protein